MTMHIRQAQSDLWRNKVAKGFNLTDVQMEFMLLHGEVAEAFTEWRRGDKTKLGLELADVVLYAMSMAEMNDIDLETSIEMKLAINAGRQYIRDQHTGVMVKTTDA
jgi:NTP pyrophosphatase (non-canonical NTP hydrolase)